jgi:hypothetical protein
MARDDAGAGESGGSSPGSSGGRAAWLAFLLATIVAGGFVVNGYAEMSSGGCDGGTCLVALVVGVVRGCIAWVITFPAVWLVSALILGRTSRR